MAGLKNHNESNIHLWDHVLLGESSLDDACVYLDVHLSHDGAQTWFSNGITIIDSA